MMLKVIFHMLYSNEEVLSFTESEWREKIEGDKKVALIAFDKSEPIGTVRLYIENTERKKHIAIIRGLYVCEKFRGMGIGRLLMSEILKEAKNFSDVLKVKLEVASDLEDAIKVYKSLGFVNACILKKEVKLSKNVFLDKLIMELFI